MIGSSPDGSSSYLPHSSKGSENLGKGPTYSKGKRFLSNRDPLTEEAFRDFYGPERGELEFETFQQPGYPVQALIEEWLKKMEEPQKQALRYLLRDWNQIVPVAYQRFFKPVAIETGILKIEVLTSTATYAISELSHHLLHKIREYLQKQGFHEIQIQEICFLLGGIPINPKKGKVFRKKNTHQS